jgi:thioredoxin 1
MGSTITLNDRELEATLSNGKPVLLLFSNGDGLRSEFSSTFRRAADENADIVFAQIDPAHNPQAAERFEVGTKPVLFGVFEGEILARRLRPWGSDVTLTVDLLKETMKERNPDPEPESTEPKGQNGVTDKVIDTKPVIVTDATFQEEVIDHDLPVLVDFWAPWCGPCKMVGPILDKLAEEYAGKIRVAKVNTDENPGLSQSFRIMSIPTIMAVKDRTIVFSQPGAFPEAAFRDLIDQLIELEVPEREEETDPAG